MGQSYSRNWTAGLSPWFHLGFQNGYPFWTHSQLALNFHREPPPKWLVDMDAHLNGRHHFGLLDKNVRPLTESRPNQDPRKTKTSTWRFPFSHPLNVNNCQCSFENRTTKPTKRSWKRKEPGGTRQVKRSIRLQSQHVITLVVSVRTRQVSSC